GGRRGAIRRLEGSGAPHRVTPVGPAPPGGGGRGGGANPRPAGPEGGESPAMSEHLWSPRISRRSVLRGGAAAALAAGLPPAACAAKMPPARGAAAGPHDRRPVNIRVSRDGYAGHGEPSVAVNPRNPRNLLGACMVWHGNQLGHEVIATYASFDGGRAWRSNGAVPLPHNTAHADGVSVAFDPAGRG